MAPRIDPKQLRAPSEVARPGERRNFSIGRHLSPEAEPFQFIERKRLHQSKHPTKQDLPEDTWWTNSAPHREYSITPAAPSSARRRLPQLLRKPQEQEHPPTPRRAILHARPSPWNEPGRSAGAGSDLTFPVACEGEGCATTRCSAAGALPRNRLVRHRSMARKLMMPFCACLRQRRGFRLISLPGPIAARWHSNSAWRFARRSKA